MIEKIDEVLSTYYDLEIDGMSGNEWVVHSFGEFLQGVGRASKWGSLRRALTFPSKEVTQRFLKEVALAGPPDSYEPMHVKEALCVEVMGS